MQEDPIGAVNHMLQAAGNGNGDWLEGVDDQEFLLRSFELKRFAYVVRSKRTSEVLGQSQGHSKKKDAKKAAYSAALANPALKELIAAERQQPIVPTPATPAPAAEVPRGAIARLNDQLQYWRMLSQ
jgi:hypothetical protein